MHRRLDYELLPLDTEIKRSLRSLRKTKRVAGIFMVENHIHRNEEGHPQQRTLVEILEPAIDDNYSEVIL